MMEPHLVPGPGSGLLKPGLSGISKRCFTWASYGLTNKLSPGPGSFPGKPQDDVPESGILKPGNSKGVSITVPLTCQLTGLESVV